MRLFATIDKYEVRETLEEGQLLKSYKCFDRNRQRFVHLDVLACPNEDRRRGFLRDAHIASRLHHDNLARVLDFGVVEEEAYLVREYLSGVDLRARVSTGEPLPLRAKLSLLKQLAEALEYAHANGSPHRHLRPERILVLPGNRIKITGLAQPSLATEDRQLLLEARGNVLSLAYRSPEQLEGRDVDARTDLFSFAVIAYELLAGTRPFSGNRFSQLLVEITESDPVPLHLVWRGSSPGFADLISQCLEKDPKKRCNDFAPLVRELSLLMGEGDPSQTKQPAEPHPHSSDPSKERPKKTTKSVQEAKSEAPGLPAKTSPGLKQSWTRAFQKVSQRGGTLIDAMPRELLLGSLGILLIGTFGLLLWWALPFPGHSNSPSPAHGEATNPAVPPPVAPSTTPAETLGELLLEGAPWGELRQIVDSRGRTLENPADAATPLLLPLPPGEYRIQLVGPKGLQERSCQTLVEAGKRSLCRAEFDPMDSLDYFQEAGWWQ
ncbi:MAG: serine/threonine protein kinase [Deltaproteobacteria bacterium]|nr:serine/threonine protein kinase [Deltaproteobacteria bacterium]